MSSTKKHAKSLSDAKAAKPSKRLKQALNTAPTQKLDIYVFGSGDNGELGLGHETRNGKKPTKVKRPRLNDLLDANTVGVVGVAVGGMHCVALTHDNKIITWGVNDNGALGRDTKWEAPTKDIDADSDSDDDDDSGLNPKESRPMAIDGGLFPKDVVFVQVEANDSASFVLTDDGSVYGWGTFSGNDGVIGFSKEAALNDEKIRQTPTIIPGLKNIKALAAGGNHALALDDKGHVFSWGSGGQYQLGRPVMERYRLHALAPSRIHMPRGHSTPIKSISCGSFHGFGVSEEGQVFAWGLNNYGQTGIPTGAGEGGAFIEKPTLLANLQDYRIQKVQGGSHHSIACTEDGKLLVWGRCEDFQAGVPLENIPREDIIFDAREKPRILVKPTVIPEIHAVSVAAGIDDCIAITNDGKAYSWGFSENYRTGQGTDDAIKTATVIENTAIKGKKMTFAACGGQFSLLAGPATQAQYRY